MKHVTQVFPGGFRDPLARPFHCAMSPVFSRAVWGRKEKTDHHGEVAGPVLTVHMWAEGSSSRAASAQSFWITRVHSFGRRWANSLSRGWCFWTSSHRALCPALEKETPLRAIVISLQLLQGVRYMFCVPQSTGRVWYVGLAILACLPCCLSEELPPLCCTLTRCSWVAPCLLLLPLSSLLWKACEPCCWPLLRRLMHLWRSLCPGRKCCLLSLASSSSSHCLSCSVVLGLNNLCH